MGDSRFDSAGVSPQGIEAESRARIDLERYHVECVSVLLCQTKLPEDLMQTQTKRIIAEQQQEVFKMEQRSQAERTEKEKMRATADQQPTFVALAEGNAEAKALEGSGEGKRLKAIGEREASKIAAIGDATAQAYSKQQEAIGEEAIKQIKIVELIAAMENGQIKIVPDVLVNGGGNAADGLMGMLTKIMPGIDLSAFSKKPGEPDAGPKDVVGLLQQ
jgi:regulator of protease activity HflC (stomatin/prohibitin superfamily)